MGIVFAENVEFAFPANVFFLAKKAVLPAPAVPSMLADVPTCFGGAGLDICIEVVIEFDFPAFPIGLGGGGPAGGIFFCGALTVPESLCEDDANDDVVDDVVDDGAGSGDDRSAAVEDRVTGPVAGVPRGEGLSLWNIEDAPDAELLRPVFWERGIRLSGCCWPSAALPLASISWIFIKSSQKSQTRSGLAPSMLERMRLAVEQLPQITFPQLRQWWRRFTTVKKSPQIMQRVAFLSGTHTGAEAESSMPFSYSLVDSSRLPVRFPLMHSPKSSNQKFFSSIVSPITVKDFSGAMIWNPFLISK